uniref:Uncharacterized protein n=1 Tax=Tanacetum cinerariifolium TaxID=118510 RepID=A0A6L2NST6_TANCI|nr:hypothetical protein [Tanacetum cinerariifolium]
MGNVKKYVAERTRHKRQHDRRVNARQMQTQKGKHDTSSKSGNDTYADDEDIRPIYDEEPMDKVQLTTELESIFGPMFDEYFNGENQVVSKSFATADASDKRQQQSDAISSTSTLATTVTADGNFNLVFSNTLALLFRVRPLVKGVTYCTCTRTSNSNKNCSMGEIVSLDEEEENVSFQDKYEHVSQRHKMIKKVKKQDDSRQGNDARIKILGTQSQMKKAQDEDHKSIKEQSQYKQDKRKIEDQRRQSSKSNKDNLNIKGDC